MTDIAPTTSSTLVSPVHGKRDWNESADSLDSAALQLSRSNGEVRNLVTLNRLDAILVAKIEDEIPHVYVVTTRFKARSGVRSWSDPAWLHEEVVREPCHLTVEQIKEKVCISQPLQSTITNFVDLDEAFVLMTPPNKGSPSSCLDPELLYKGFMVPFDRFAKTEMNGGYGSCDGVDFGKMTNHRLAVVPRQTKQMG
ncbi:LOW QUALITY PROTEIN: hypothetical protein PHMEG_00011117 [Phytophthora megakarya]|uniref:Reverse transcriptase n=1 Tax=Phytophthora megakarya TaxID=4795 RepID=A0A225WE29_9STRA|nr:LOW QUALITY PROTEIN: hypothetical protein PHMEG_00011117 [Phytophthora megakarya]